MFIVCIAKGIPDLMIVTLFGGHIPPQPVEFPFCVLVHIALIRLLTNRRT